MQALAIVHVGAGENMMNRMAMFCLGERAHPPWHGQAKSTRHKQLGANDCELV